MINKIYILILLLIFQSNFAQEDCKSEMYSILINTIEKKTGDGIVATFVEIKSGKETIGYASGDYDGYALAKICAEKIKNNTISLKVFGIKSVPKTVTCEITSDTSILLEVDYGESPFNTIKERQNFIEKEYKIPFCGLVNE